MPFRSRTIAREVSTAFAVLAIYVLVLMAPLHQAANLQRDLTQLGYASAYSWSICTPLTEDNGGTPYAAVKCAVAGIGKNKLAPVEPVALAIGVARSATAVAYASAHLIIRPVPDRYSGQPRAPPMSV